MNLILHIAMSAEQEWTVSNMSWTAFVIITGTIVIVFYVLLLGLIERIENLESSVHALCGSVNRLGYNDDELRARVWKLEHKEGEQNG